MTEVLEHQDALIINDAFNSLAKKVEKIAETLMPVAEVVARAIKVMSDLYISFASTFSSKRVVHLMKYGKKNRTRKKNMHRLHKNFLIFLKRHKKGENDEDS